MISFSTAKYLMHIIVQVVLAVQSTLVHEHETKQGTPSILF